MSRVYFAADLHIGHKNIANFRTQFSSAEEHDGVVMGNILTTVTKKDKLYLLGDIAFTDEALDKIASIPCRKVLVIGNHDTELKRGITFQKIVDTYDEIHSLSIYKDYWITHCPIHPQEIRQKKGVIYGHTHQHSIDDPRYQCVSLEHINYRPIVWSKLEERFNG